MSNTFKSLSDKIKGLADQHSPRVAEGGNKLIAALQKLPGKAEAMVSKTLSGRDGDATTDAADDTPAMMGKLERTKMSFRSENVGLFLHWVNANSDILLPEDFIDDVLYDLPDIKLNTNKAFTTRITLRSEPEALRLNIFMEDEDAPDLYFFGSEAVAAEMDKALQRFQQELDS